MTDKPKSKHRTLIYVAGGVVLFILAPYLLVLASLGWSRLTERIRRVSFDPVDWSDSAQVHADRPVRIRMIDDLLTRYDFRDWSDSQVVELLGVPPAGSSFGNYDLVYWLGRKRGVLMSDRAWLAFRLDSTRVVVEYKLVTD